MARGRPAKAVPEVSDTVIRRVKKIIKEYLAEKEYCERIPQTRKNLFYLMDVCTDRYEETGIVSYNREAIEKICLNDQQIIRTYEKRMQDIWLLEHGVASIPDDRTRAIAEDTLIKGQRTEDMIQEYGISRRTAFIERNRAIRHIADFIEKTGRE